ncbi:TlyA family RNA methyltransferase [Mollicutes bacterium LVI A0039]|nr:TlyA family RNA methyltransferase [Mollicutes bacterium LVI A0039]
MAKIRIDQYLADSGIVESREKAKRSVMAGIVYVGTERVNKASEKFTEEQLENVTVKGKECPYVSRAGLKLEKAIKIWNLDVQDKMMLDVGSSTGGFTDCALQHGMNHVVALDVGTNQLVYKLRVDERVTVMEQTNFRTVETSDFEQLFDFITMDVSFISIKLLLENVAKLLKDDGKFICLIKPQFEVGKDVPRNTKGVITDFEVYRPLLHDMKAEFEKYQMYINELTVSPIKGGKGNIEFLVSVSKSMPAIEAGLIDQVVDKLK